MDSTCIITYANQKGGVGKTTLCALFASYLVSKGHRVAVFDTDPQQSIAKKRASDLEVYSGCQVPYAVYSFSLNNEKALISLIGNIRGSGHFDFVLFDSAGSLTDQALLALFANTDYLLTPIHYDYLSVPSTAVLGAGFSSRDRWVTSSTMPMVNSRLGWALLSSSKTANTLAGGVSLEPRP